MTTTLEYPDYRQMPRKLWNRTDVRRMLEHGLLDSTKHYELIEGEIIEKVGHGRRHILIINRLFKILGLEVYRQPTPDGYALSMVLTEAETVRPLMMPTSDVSVHDLLP